MPNRFQFESHRNNIAGTINHVATRRANDILFSQGIPARWDIRSDQGRVITDIFNLDHPTIEVDVYFKLTRNEALEIAKAFHDVALEIEEDA